MDQTMKLNAWVLQWWLGFSGVFRSLFLAVSIDGFLIAVVVCQVHWMFELLLSAHVGLFFLPTEVPSGKRCFLDVTVPRAFGTIRIYFPQFVV